MDLQLRMDYKGYSSRDAHDHVQHHICPDVAVHTQPFCLLCAVTMSSSKRPRTSTHSSSSTSSTPSEPAPKTTRISISKEQAQPNLLCTLPPTCHPPHNRPTPIANSKDLEIHYANFHAHVCEDCRGVFPDARLLELVCPPPMMLGSRRLFSG